MNQINCQCGTVYGERCEWRGPASSMVLLEWMPNSLRDSHAAARNSGDWPMNGSERLEVHWECADRIIENEGDPEGWPEGCCWVRRREAR